MDAEPDTGVIWFATMQASSPSDSGHEPVSGMTANNDNNILTNDKSCGTVSPSMSACLSITSDCDDDRASGASAEWTRCKPFLRSRRPIARVLTQPTVAIEPSQSALDKRALGLDFKALLLTE